MPVFAPQFNLTCDLWTFPNVPPSPADASPDCQLYLASRGILDITPGSPTLWVPPVWLRLPKLTDVRPGDTVECPQGTGRMYAVRWVDDAHKGFENEYRMALLEQTAQPFPLP